MADPVNLSLSVMLSVIHTMEKEVAKLDKEIQKLMKSIPKTLSTVKGIGPVFAAGSLLKSVTLLVSLTITLWLNIPTLFGLSISPGSLKAKRPSDYGLETNTFATT